MRNAVIRKKRLKAERIVDDFIRMPQRIVLGADIPADFDWSKSAHNSRLWAL